MTKNFFQDKWLKDQFNRTEQKERERLEEIEKRKKWEEEAKKAPDDQKPAENALGT